MLFISLFNKLIYYKYLEEKTYIYIPYKIKLIGFEIR